MMKKALATATFAAVIGIGGFAVTAGSALADIACNDEGDCWHVKERPTYPAGPSITIHPDDWHWGTNEKFQFREHEGRGYWHGGVWIGF
jgi:hypothetical protein